MPTLTWVGKDKVVNHHHDVPFRVLNKQYTFNAQHSTAQHSTAQHSTAQHSTAQHNYTEPPLNNRIIHGDNLEALKSLLPEFEGKINCIYIDPPYNTGNEGWVYNDNVNNPKLKKWLGQVVGKEGEDLSRHDKWLCMMYPRLKLLHRLLADDGVIFVSIDDNEQATLKLLMDDIFGLNGFITSIAWFKKVSPSNDARWFSNDHEFILVYAKNKVKWFPHKLDLNKKQQANYKNPDNDIRGAWNSSTYTCNKTADERPNLYYPLTNPTTGFEVYPKRTAVWAYSKDLYEQHAKDNLIYWGVGGKATMPRFKTFLSESTGVVPRTVWHYDDAGHTQEATQVLRQIISEEIFATPKPPRLIEKILHLATDKNSIILDSFAGSGTTAHAVLKLNQDSGNRKFILIETENYAQTITAERVRRVMDGYGEGDKAVAGLGGSFDYYTVGEPLFLDDKNLNEAVGVEAIRNYVTYTEGIPAERQAHANAQAIKVSPYALGVSDTALWLFYYEPSKVTTLDMDFLASLNINALLDNGGTRPEAFIVYADKCALNKDFLAKHNISFKRIPRDITKF